MKTRLNLIASIIFMVCFSFTSLSQETENKSTEIEKTNKKHLKGLTKASDDYLKKMSDKKEFQLDIASYPIYDDNGQKISVFEIQGIFNPETHKFDIYLDENDDIELFVLREMSEDEKIEMAKLMQNQSMKNTGNKTYDSLAAKLETVYKTDQEIRRKISTINNKYGAKSEEFKNVLQKMREVDKENLHTVQNILDNHGWLGPEEIGSQGNMTLFLVIQHSDVSVQEKYYPIMKEAVDKGNAEASQLALLEDRIAVSNGKKQIYGSQVNTDRKTGDKIFFEIKDPEKVDKRRKEVGLAPLSDYAKMMGFEWDIEKHKKRYAK